MFKYAPWNRCFLLKNSIHSKSSIPSLSSRLAVKLECQKLLRFRNFYLIILSTHADILRVLVIHATVLCQESLEIVKTHD